MNKSPACPVPFRISTRDSLKCRLRRRAPLLVWLGVLAAALPLYLRQESGLTVTGVAEEIRYSVASESAGRLQRLAVTLNEDVSRGQIVAIFETDGLRLQLQAAQAELERLAHELVREQTRWEFDAAGQEAEQLTNLRRFARDASSIHLEHLAALADLAANRISLQGLELNLDRSRQLAANDLISAAELDADRIAFEALSEKVAGLDSTAAILLAATLDADARYRKYLGSTVTGRLDPVVQLKPLESAIKVQETQIEMVNLAILECALRAPIDGRVAEIFRQDGEVAAAGEPLLSIVDPRSTRLLAYVPERGISDLHLGDKVRVRRISDPARSFTCYVAGLGASVEPLPQRLSPADAAPGWGLAVTIPLSGSHAAIPGESFEISF